MDKVDKAATESLDTDILILGAGPVGMTLALALADSGQRIHLLDRRPRGAWADDPRGLALSHGCRQLLERLDAWNAAAGTPIKDIHVSQRGGFGRTMINASDSPDACRAGITLARMPIANVPAPGSNDLSMPTISSQPRSIR